MNLIDTSVERPVLTTVMILALLVFGTIGAGYYMTQRSIAIPIVMVTLIGGVTITRFPLPAQQGLLGVFVISIAGVGYLLLQRVRTT